jgi:hypothetical protein
VAKGAIQRKKKKARSDSKKLRDARPGKKPNTKPQKKH